MTWSAVPVFAFTNVKSSAAAAPAQAQSAVQAAASISDFM
jgi:hypothetical protein